MPDGVRVFQPVAEPGDLTPEIDTVEVALDGEIRQRQRVISNPEGEVAGVITAVGQVVEILVPNGASSFNVQLAGTFSAGSQVIFEGHTGLGVWFPTNGRLNPMTSAQSGQNNISRSDPTGPGPLHYRGSASGFSRFRVRCIAFAPGDSIDVVIRVGTSTGGTFLIAGIPSGQAFIGYVSDYEARAVESGRYRFAGSKVTTSVTTPNASLTLSNPLDSANDIIITRYSVEVDAGADIILITGATSSGTLVTNLNPNQSTEFVTRGEARAGAGVLTGGTVHSPIRHAQMNSPVAVGPFEWRMPPGTTWTIRFLGPGATNTCWFNIGWYEVDAGGRLL